MSCNNSGTQSAQRRENNSMMMRKMEAPSTPGRPFFSFSVSRKSVPSKWDNAEKWLFNGGGGSCNESPAHPAFVTSNNDNNNRPICLTDVEYREGDMCATFTTNNNHVHDHHNYVVKQSEVSRNSNSKSMINEVMVLEENKIKEVTLSKFINWSNASDTSLEDHYKQQEQQLSSSITFNGVIIPADFPLKDKYTDEINPFTTNFGYSDPTKEAFMFESHNGEAMTDAYTEVIPIQESTHRDVGTEMTPLGSNTTSRCNTPLKNISPVRHNTPASLSGPLALTGQPISSLDMVQLQECHFAKLQIGSTQFDSVATNWSSREEEEEEISKSLRHFEIGRRRSVTVNETRVSWEEEEKSKFCLRYQREEAKIQAWLNLQTAKAEAQSKKLEVKIQKMRSNLEEKLMKRMAIVHRKAEEWRVTAQVEHSEQIKKASERAKSHHKSSHLSSHIISCGCFPCNSN